jgi:hypothetical protein
MSEEPEKKAVRPELLHYLRWQGLHVHGSADGNTALVTLPTRAAWNGRFAFAQFHAEHGHWTVIRPDGKHRTWEGVKVIDVVELDVTKVEDVDPVIDWIRGGQ